MSIHFTKYHEFSPVKLRTVETHWSLRLPICSETCKPYLLPTCLVIEKIRLTNYLAVSAPLFNPLQFEKLLHSPGTLWPGFWMSWLSSHVYYMYSHLQLENTFLTGSIINTVQEPGSVAYGSCCKDCINQDPAPPSKVNNQAPLPVLILFHMDSINKLQPIKLSFMYYMLCKKHHMLYSQ